MCEWQYYSKDTDMGKAIIFGMGEEWINHFLNHIPLTQVNFNGFKKIYGTVLCTMNNKRPIIPFILIVS